jgi:hypothetical protein
VTKTTLKTTLFLFFQTTVLIGRQKKGVPVKETQNSFLFYQEIQINSALQASQSFQQTAMHR